VRACVLVRACVRVCVCVFASPSPSPSLQTPHIKHTHALSSSFNRPLSLPPPPPLSLFPFLSPRTHLPPHLKILWPDACAILRMTSPLRCKGNTPKGIGHVRHRQRHKTDTHLRHKGKTPPITLTRSPFASGFSCGLSATPVANASLLYWCALT
jgi:hypothetical protein